MNQNNKALECESFFHLTLQEITYSLRIPEETILEIIDEGIIDIQYHNVNELRFDTEAFYRIHTIVKLNRDLGVNIAGAALAIQLLDEISVLKDKLKIKG